MNMQSVVVTPCHSREDEQRSTVVGDVGMAGSLMSSRLPEQPQHWLDWLHAGAPMAMSDWDTLQKAAMESPNWQICHPTQHGHKVVRWTGMIQDMLEPEYFSGRELDNGGGTMANRMEQLFERTPVVMVSLPCSTRRQEARTDSNDIRESKRLKLEMPESTTETGLSNDANVVLVNFYMDQYPITDKNQSLSPLKLNQMVEVYGILDDETSPDDTMEVAASESQPQDDMWDEGNVEAILPIHVPRLHVMWFRVASLEDSTTCCPDSNANVLPPDMTERLAQVLQSNGSNDDGPLPPTKLVARAVWMLLHSMAERQSDGSVVATPHETSLGCAALNIIMSAADHRQTDRLIQALEVLTPVVQVVTLTADTLDRLAPPSRQESRLTQTAWQLPAGSVLVLDIQALSPKTFQPQYVSARQWSHWQTCVELCRQHKIHYTFEGGVRIPFEADYRIIVLSNSENAGMLPCALTVQWDVDSYNQRFSVANPTEHDVETLLGPLRNSLRCSRSPRGNIGLDPALLERAQANFLQRRAAHRAFVGEDDFHRWLTLTRLQARSRQSHMANVDDWTAALCLDDAMQASLSPAIRTKLGAPEM